MTSGEDFVSARRAWRAARRARSGGRGGQSTTREGGAYRRSHEVNLCEPLERVTRAQACVGRARAQARRRTLLFQIFNTNVL